MVCIVLTMCSNKETLSFSILNEENIRRPKIHSKKYLFFKKKLINIFPYLLSLFLLFWIIIKSNRYNALLDKYQKLSDNVLNHIFSPYKTEIIENIEELSLLKQWIKQTYEIKSPVTLKLVYQATKDGGDAESFHQKTNIARGYLIVIKDEMGNRFGGYTSLNFEGDNYMGMNISFDKVDRYAFLFSLTLKEKYEVREGMFNGSVKGDEKNGPFFGVHGDIGIMDNFLTEKSYTNFPDSFWDKSKPWDFEKNKFRLTGGKQAFYVKQLEAYKVYVLK